MKELKPIDIYVPVSVKKELPPIEESVCFIASKLGSDGLNGYIYCGWLESDKTWTYRGEFGEVKNFENNPDFHYITHWLKPLTSQFVFTKEELVALLEDIYCEAAWQEQDGYHARNTQKTMREQYIKSILP